jgi:hypothetical protein
VGVVVVLALMFLFWGGATRWGQGALITLLLGEF